MNVGIQRIAKLFIEKRIKIFEGCEDLIREIEGYCYDKKGSAKPGHDCSHSPDALRYGFSKSLAGVYDLVRVGGIARKGKNTGFDPLDLHKKQIVSKAEREPNELMEYKSFTNITNEDQP